MIFPTDGEKFPLGKMIYRERAFKRPCSFSKRVPIDN